MGITINGGTTITGGITLYSSNPVNPLDIFTTQPGDWLGYVTGSGSNISGNTLSTGPSDNYFVFGDIATQTKLIGMFGDPGVNNAYGGHFTVTWSSGSTLPVTNAFVVLYTGADGPITLSPGQYGIYIQLLDSSFNVIGAGDWNFPATFTLIEQLF